MNQLNIHTYGLFSGFPSHLGHHRALSRVPCALQSFIISYLFYTLCSFSVASVVSNSVTLWTVAHQAPLSTGFSRQECWRGLPLQWISSSRRSFQPRDQPCVFCIYLHRQAVFVLFCFVTTKAVWEAIVCGHSAFMHCFHTPGRSMDEGHGANCVY